MQAYVDDSGRGDPPVAVLAGFMARPDPWASLMSAWDEVLHLSPNIEYFKMQEAFTLTGQFFNWDAKDRDAKVEALAEIARGHVLCAISSFVFHDDYRRMMVGRIHKQMDQPWFVLYHNVLFSAVKWQIDNGICEPIDFIFDDAIQNEQDLILNSWEHSRTDGPDFLKPRLGLNPYWENDKRVVALQAADLFAWHVRRGFYDQGRGRLYRSRAWDILKKIPHQQTHVTADHVQHLARETVKVNRKTLSMFPYQWEAFFDNLDLLVEGWNLRDISNAQAGDTITLHGIPANGMKRFRMVRKCELVGSPHLHRRSGNGCLEAAQVSTSPDESPNA